MGGFRALFPEQTKVISGLDFIAQLCDLDSRIAKADLVITGEGSYDSQTLQGKAVQRILQKCEALKTPVIVVCGRTTL